VISSNCQTIRVGLGRRDYEHPSWGLVHAQEGLRRNAQRRRAHQLEWVYRQMRLQLTARERNCVVLHYLRGMTFQEIAAETHTDRSSACRAASRAIRKLRAAVEVDTSWKL